MKAELPMRNDSVGLGHYGAPRGGRTHRGIDYAALPDTVIFPDKPGQVSWLGYVYNGDYRYRYVQVTDTDGYEHRYFYLNPLVKVGEFVDSETPIGTVQDLTLRHGDKIICHCHKEVKKDGDYFNPDDFT